MSDEEEYDSVDAYSCEHGYGDYGYGCSECEEKQDLESERDKAIERAETAEAKLAAIGKAIGLLSGTSPEDKRPIVQTLAENCGITEESLGKERYRALIEFIGELTKNGYNLGMIGAESVLQSFVEELPKDSPSQIPVVGALYDAIHRLQTSRF